jgi:hypothetical protein
MCCRAKEIAAALTVILRCGELAERQRGSLAVRARCHHSCFTLRSQSSLPLFMSAKTFFMNHFYSYFYLSSKRLSSAAFPISCLTLIMAGRVYVGDIMIHVASSRGRHVLSVNTTSFIATKCKLSHCTLVHC